MLRLLALALLLAPATHAQAALFDCSSDEDWMDLDRVTDSGPFAVWGEDAGFRDGRAPQICQAPSDDRDEATAVLSLDETGTLLLDAVVMRGGEPLPFAVVVAATRDERNDPIRLAAVGVADRNGVVTMVLPASRNAIRLTVSGGDGAPGLDALREDEHVGHENPTFVGQAGAMTNVLHAMTSGGDGNGGAWLAANSPAAKKRIRQNAVRRLRNRYR